MIHVRTTANFFGKVSYRINLNGTLVFFPEQSHGSVFFGFFKGHHYHRYLEIRLYLIVHYLLDFGYLFGRHRRRMGKIETHAFRRYVRALLADMVAQHHPERLLKKMGRGMIRGSLFRVIGQSALE